MLIPFLNDNCKKINSRIASESSDILSSTNNIITGKGRWWPLELHGEINNLVLLKRRQNNWIINPANLKKFMFFKTK